jgi:AraC-like DNA-binding protein
MAKVARMRLQESDFAPRRFSTRNLPEHERVAYWRDFFARGVVNSDVEIDPDPAFHAEAELLVWPQLRGLWSRESAMSYSRSRSQAADGDDAFVLIIRLSGISTLSQGGNDVPLGAGDAAGFLSADPAAAAVSEVDALMLSVPRVALAPLVGSVESKAMKRIPRECEALRLLTSYAEVLRQTPVPMTAELRHLASTHIHDLVAIALGTTRDGAAIAEGRGLRAARLRAIKADILAHLGSSRLTVGAVALRQGVSPRYVHMIFEAEGVTFSEFVLGKRLARTYRMLTDPRFRHMTISAIAFAAGFGDLSYFNHSFRRRFGATPSEVRRAEQSNF